MNVGNPPVCQVDSDRQETRAQAQHGTEHGTKTVFARIYVITTTDGELTPSHRQGGYFLNLHHLEIFTIVVEVFSGKISTPGLGAGPDDYIMFFLAMPPLS